MGAACCVAAKDRTIINRPSDEMLQRHVRYSPSWSFRWENSGRVAGEETQANCSPDGGDGSDKFEVKYATAVETAFASEEGRPVYTSLIPGCNSPTHSISEKVSSSLPPAWSNDSTRGSNFGSSDSLSIPIFSELMTTRRQRWSFDSENSSFSLENISRSSGQNSGSPSIDLQTFGVCAKLLTERSSWVWNCHKIILANQLAVVSVLACGHVFHAECLEYLTPEINKYDPAWPVCTYGEKWAVQMSEKALKAELEAKKRSRKHVHSGLKSNFCFYHNKSGVEGRGPKFNSTAGMRSSLGKPFLERHFLFSSKAGKSSPDNQHARRKRLFWARFSKD